MIYLCCILFKVINNQYKIETFYKDGTLKGTWIYDNGKIKSKKPFKQTWKYSNGNLVCLDENIPKFTCKI